MAITKAKKVDLVKQYVHDLQDAKNAVIVRQSAIPVSTASKIRKEVSIQDGKLNVVRKRLFLRALKEAGLEEVGLDQLEGPIFAVYAKENEFWPLKVINKYLKEFKAEDKWAKFSFVGGWFEKKRQSGDYVNELANVPSKEELLSKLCYLFNYPLQSFACVLNEIAKKNAAPATEQSKEVPQGGIEEKKVEEKKVEEVKVEEVKNEEVKEEVKTEAPVEEKKEDAPTEEPKTEESKMEAKEEPKAEEKAE